MSTAEKTSSAPATETDGSKTLTPVAEYVTLKRGDDSRVEDVKGIVKAVEDAVAAFEGFAPADAEVTKFTQAGCDANIAIRRLCLRGDNGARDYYGVSEMYAELWKTYCGGSAAEKFRSRVASMMSAKQMIQTAIAEDVAREGLAGKSAGVKLDNVQALIAAEKELPAALTAAVDKVLATQVYTGKGKSAGKRVQGAETAIKAFGKRPKAAATPSGATGGNATSATVSSAVQTLAADFAKTTGGLAKPNAAAALHRLASALVLSMWGAPGEAAPESDTDAVKGRHDATATLDTLRQLCSVAVALEAGSDKVGKDDLKKVMWKDTDSK